MAFEVEYRAGRYYAVDKAARVELAPVFDNLTTAQEIAEKANRCAPFFDRIPVCDYDSPPTHRRNARVLQRS